MTIAELKARVEKQREHLRQNDGNTCLMSESGPVGISVIDAIVQVLEAQQKRIDELERRAPSRGDA